MEVQKPRAYLKRDAWLRLPEFYLMSSLQIVIDFASVYKPSQIDETGGH